MWGAAIPAPDVLYRTVDGAQSLRLVTTAGSQILQRNWRQKSWSTMHHRYTQLRSGGRRDANVANCRVGLSVHTTATLVERLCDFIFFSHVIPKFCRVVRSCFREWGKPEPASALASHASAIWWQHEGCESTTHARRTRKLRS